MSSNHCLLKLPTNAVQNVRKIHNLDKPERLEEAVGILQDWIQKQDHIVKKDFSVRYLDSTLITCKGSVEKAKKQIDKLCTMKTLVPKFFSKTNVKVELRDILDIAFLVPLPVITNDYYRACMVKITNKTTDNLMQCYQYCAIFCEYLKANDYVNGFIIIYDFRELNVMDLMTKLNTVELQQFINIVIECYGTRVKSLHILTESKTIDLLIKTVKQLVSKKIGNRIRVHATLKDLHKHVPKEILPIEYGGDEKSIQKLHEECIEELSSEKHVEYMRMMNKANTDESRRRADKFNEQYMGMPGSFRNLSVD